MRVALVGPYPHDPARVGGGVESAFTYLVSSLAKSSGVEPSVVTFVPGLERPSRESVDGAPVIFLPGTQRWGNATLHARERRSLAATLRSLRPDVVHAQDTLRYGFVSLRAARGVPVAVNVHGIVQETLRHESSVVAQAKIRVAGVAMERYCVGRADLLIASTPYPEQYFGDVARGRFVDVRNPISDLFFAVRSDPEPGRILYVAAVTPLKRVVDLIAALPRVRTVVPEARLYVAGGELDPEYARTARTRVRELGLEGCVTFLGSLSPEDVRDQYRRASVFCLPSAQETSPLTIGEAMAAGVPVVGTRVGGVPYLVDDGVTGQVVEPGDVEALATSLAGILGDPARQRELGTAARACAERDFRIEVAARRLGEAYERLAEDYGRR